MKKRGNCPANSNVHAPGAHVRTRVPEDWPWVVEQIEGDPALQVTTLFALLCAQNPGKYRPTQVRTLQRQVATWKVTQGPEKEGYFEQVHTPGERAQSDFTHMEDLNVTIAGEPFPHMLYHCVLTYSNEEAVSLCFAETFEALAFGSSVRCGNSAACRCSIAPITSALRCADWTKWARKIGREPLRGPDAALRDDADDQQHWGSA